MRPLLEQANDPYHGVHEAGPRYERERSGDDYALQHDGFLLRL